MRAKPRLSLTCGITHPPFPHMVLNLSCCVLWLCKINFGRQLIWINYKQHAVFQNFTTQSTQLKFFKYSNFICLCAEFCSRKWSTHNTIIQANHVSLLYFQIFNVFSNFTAMYTKINDVFVIKMRFSTIWVAQSRITNKKYFFVFTIGWCFPHDSFQVQGKFSSS